MDNNAPNASTITIRRRIRQHSARVVKILSENCLASFISISRSKYGTTSTATQSCVSPQMMMPIPNQLLTAKATWFEHVRSRLWSEALFKGINHATVLFLERKFLHKLSPIAVSLILFFSSNELLETAIIYMIFSYV